MKLPNRALPQYTVHLKASDVKVKYRPHTVKEEQILNMAQMSTEDIDKLNAIFQIVENCVDYDIGKLFPAEVEYLFMKIRATSDTPKIPIEYTVMPELDDDGNDIHAKCGDTIKSFFDIDKDIKITYSNTKLEKYATRSSDGSWIIDMTEGLKLKIRVRAVSSTSEDALFELSECIIDEQADEDQPGVMYKDTHYNKAEFIEWINEMPTTAFKQFEGFMSNLPKCVAKLKFKCKCGKVVEESETGILSFLV